MRRRRFLAAMGAATVGSTAAGCLGAPGGPGGTPTDEPNTPTPEPPTDPPPVTPTDATFEVRSRDCGTGRNEATIDFAGEEVAVEGVIGGRDSCDTARLSDVRLRDGVLTVTVEVVEEPHTATVACAECLTDIAYAFTTTVPGDPLTVRVVHRSADGTATVATADRP